MKEEFNVEVTTVKKIRKSKIVKIKKFPTVIE